MAGLLAALCAGAFWSQAAMGQEEVGDGCTPNCVILIQVDGLEPKDVTSATTPYLWALAHPPSVQGQTPPQGALRRRSGWIWQAPRTTMSTGTAASTASLLTGAYPEKNGVPADEFIEPISRHRRLGAGGFGDARPGAADPTAPDGAEPIAPEGLPVDTIVGAARKAGTEVGVFLGDPALSGIAEAQSPEGVFWFPPGDEEGSNATVAQNQYTGDPRLCPIPRYPDVGPTQETHDPRLCPANDMTTMNKAADDLATPAANRIGFTFIHLAELGIAKRRASDPDNEADPDPNTDPLPQPQPPHPSRALAETDAAVAAFAERYAESEPDKWAKTVVMVVGSHGYQTTPLAKRVPDPRVLAPGEDEETPGPSTLPTRDLSDYVASRGTELGGSFTLLPQGTLATIYYTGPQEKRTAALSQLKDELESSVDGSVNAACMTLSGNPGAVGEAGRCIEDVLYVNPADAPPADPPALPESVFAQHPTWRLDAQDAKGVRTGASGDLLVLLEPGWATGRAAGAPGQGGLDAQPVSNPYAASSGGPRERAVAALINGPADAGNPGSVRNLDSLAEPGPGGVRDLKYYPVSNGEVDPSDPNNPPRANDPKCKDVEADPADPGDPETDPGGLACANDPAEVGDDADDPGHEAQPITVDFAITVSALMGIPFSASDQLQGRVLQEAFRNRISPPREPEEPVAVVQDTPPDDPLPPPPVEVVQPKGFDFYGLVRGLKARVVDSRNRTFAQARRGSLLSTIRVEADFGKPETAVTLTFYRRAPAPRSRGRRSARGRRVVRLKPIARFDPFAVKRGHVTMRLKVPKLFKPTYIGVTVREIHTRNGRRLLSGGQPCTRLRTHQRVRFRCTGASRGIIARIVDAGRLHKRKPAPRRRR